MDVAYRIRSSWPIVFTACLFVSWGDRAQADPMYTAIDLGIGHLTFGVDSSSNGTVAGSSGLTYTFNPVQNDLPAQWRNTNQGVPIVSPSQDLEAYYPFSNSTLQFMNSQGLAAGIDWYSLTGHMSISTVFMTQRQPDGSWGTPTPLWSGTEGHNEDGPANISILGVSPNGQVLGYGVADPYTWEVLYLYDAKTHTLTNITNLLGSTAPYWFLNMGGVQLDDQGRILVQADLGFPGPPHNVLLVPEGLSPDPVPAPEPATWVVFAILLGGWMARRRLRFLSPSF